MSVPTPVLVVAILALCALALLLADARQLTSLSSSHDDVNGDAIRESDVRALHAAICAMAAGLEILFWKEAIMLVFSFLLSFLLLSRSSLHIFSSFVLFCFVFSSLSLSLSFKFNIMVVVCLFPLYSAVFFSSLSPSTFLASILCFIYTSSLWLYIRPISAGFCNQINGFLATVAKPGGCRFDAAATTAGARGALRDTHTVHYINYCFHLIFSLNWLILIYFDLIQKGFDCIWWSFDRIKETTSVTGLYLSVVYILLFFSWFKIPTFVFVLFYIKK